MSTQKSATFSESEIDAARQLIQLSSGDCDTHYDEDHLSSNNSCSVQWKPQRSKADTGGDVSSSDAIEDVLADADEEEGFRRRHKRYRYVHDLYNVREPVPAVKAKKMKRRNWKVTLTS